MIRLRGTMAFAWACVWTSVAIGAPTQAADTTADEARAIVAEAYTSGDWGAAARRARELLLQTSHAQGADAEGFVAAAYAARLTSQLDGAEPTVRAQAAPIFARYPELARVFAFLIKPEDNVDESFTLLTRLHAAHGDRISEYAALAAAIAVVHDSDSSRYAGDGMYPAATPEEVFAFYAGHGGRMFFGVKDQSAELLTYVVTAQASPREMAWALEEYAGNKQIGRTFFEVPYDTAHFRAGRDKRIEATGYTLQNLKKRGGICADQAYFASNVGRAIGVPSVYVWGRGGELSHAWPGFLELKGRDRLAWNFDFGRYSDYEDIRGNVVHPQTGETVADSVVALSARLFTTPTSKRWFAVASLDAANAALEADGDAGVAAALALLQSGLEACPAYAEGWHKVAELAEARRLPDEQKDRWANALLRLCGEESPDFVLDVVGPMARSVRNPRQQEALWKLLGERVGQRKDLAARVLVEQAEMWERTGRRDSAGRCYLEVVKRYANDGPFAVQALQACAELLAEGGRRAQVAALYADAWKAMNVPSTLPRDRIMQSNWYQVGDRYAIALAQAGNTSEAADVRQRLERMMRD